MHVLNIKYCTISHPAYRFFGWTIRFYYNQSQNYEPRKSIIFRFHFAQWLLLSVFGEFVGKMLIWTQSYHSHQYNQIECWCSRILDHIIMAILTRLFIIVTFQWYRTPKCGSRVFYIVSWWMVCLSCAIVEFESNWIRMSHRFVMSIGHFKCNCSKQNQFNTFHCRFSWRFHLFRSSLRNSILWPILLIVDVAIFIWVDLFLLVSMRFFLLFNNNFGS